MATFENGTRSILLTLISNIEEVGELQWYADYSMVVGGATGSDHLALPV
jgi:hypothetical protein